VFDDKRYQAYRQKDGTPGAFAREQYEAVAIKVPGLRQQLEPKLTIFGDLTPNNRQGAIVLPESQKERNKELSRWLLKIGKGLSAEPDNIRGFPLETKQELLRERRDRLADVMEYAGEEDREYAKAEVEKTLRRWGKYVVQMREAEGLPTSRSEKAERMAQE
jgi:hypothetical protein